MHDIIIGIMDQYGYLGIFFLAIIENILPVIPSELTLTFGGFMTTYTSMTIGGAILVATIGSVIGSVVLYFIGRRLSPEHLGKLLDGKLGKMLHLKRESYERSCEWFSRHGKIAVLICRCVPVLRCLISIPAGMSEMNFGIFIGLTAGGSAAWNTLMICIGAFAGASWEKMGNGFGHILKIVIIIAVVIAVVIFLIRKKIKQEKEDVVKKIEDSE